MTRVKTSGFSVLEVLVVSIIGVIVLGGLYGITSGTWKLGRVSQASLAVAGAATLELALSEDLIQYAPPPDCPPTEYMRVTSGAIAFYRAKFKDLERIDLEPVVYDLVKSPGGNSFLRRSDRGAPRVFRDAPIRKLEFELLAPDDGPPLLKVAAVMVDADEAPSSAPGSSIRTLPWTAVLPLPMADQLCNPTLSRSAETSVEGPLPNLQE